MGIEASVPDPRSFWSHLDIPSKGIAGSCDRKFSLTRCDVGKERRVPSSLPFQDSDFHREFCHLQHPAGAVMQNSRCRLGALIKNFTKCYNFLLENGKLLIGLGREVRKTNLTIILPNFYYSTPVGFYVDSVIALILVLSLVFTNPARFKICISSHFFATESLYNLREENRQLRKAHQDIHTQLQDVKVGFALRRTSKIIRREFSQVFPSPDQAVLQNCSFCYVGRRRGID